MNIFMKYAGMAAMAVSLVGCCDESCSEDDAQGNSAAENLSPKVVDDAQIVLLYRNNNSPALESMLRILKKGIKKEITKKPDFKKFLEKSGLEVSEINWLALSSDALDFTNKNPDMSSFAAVASIKHDSSRIIDLIAEAGEMDDSASYEAIEVSAVKALKITPKRANKASECANESFFVASLNDSILILTGSQKMLKRQIALYRGNAPASKKFNGIIENDEVVLGVSVADSGKIIYESVKADPKNGSDAEAVLSQVNYRDFGAVDFVLKSNKSGEVSAAAELETGSAADAENVVSILRTFVVATKAQLSKMVQKRPNRDGKVGLKLINQLRVGSEGARVSCTLPVSDDAMKLFFKKLEKEIE